MVALRLWFLCRRRTAKYCDEHRPVYTCLLVVCTHLRIHTSDFNVTDGRGSVQVASLPALGPWAPPAERGPSLESIYRVSLTVDLCEGNKIISFKKFISLQPVGGPSE